MQPLWEISSLVLQYILFGRRIALSFFIKFRASPIELINNIWLDMRHTLKGQWDCIIQDFDDKFSQCHQFLTV